MAILKRQLFLAVFWAATLTAAPLQDALPVIDGRLNDRLWKGLTPQSLSPAEPGVPADAGVELRAIVRGRYLFIAARVSEPTGHITARLTGRHPNWEDEDMLRITAGPDIGYTDRVLTINPLGAYSVEREGQVVYRNSDRYLVATQIGDKDWSVEVAFPLNETGAPGPGAIRMSVERIRASRPGSPRLRWRWPRFEPSARVAVDTSGKWDDAVPKFQPALLGNTEPPLRVGRGTLPPPASAWSDPPWKDVLVWRLLRNEARPLPARVPTEVKALHDGATLALLVRCIEPDSPVATVKENDGRVDQDDSFHVYLATSGSSYAQLAINPLGYLLDVAGKTGGPRISRPRADWTSGARGVVRQERGAWVVRLDIPLEPAANILGEERLPDEWRILLMRTRNAREGEPREDSMLPAIESETPLCPARYRRIVLSKAAPSSLREPTAAAPGALESLSADVLAAEPRRQLAVAGMLERHARARALKALEAEKRERDQIRTLADWERFRDTRIGALKRFFGEFPARAPLEAIVTREFPGAGYRRLDLVYRSRPGLFIPANLYLPENPRGRVPGIMIVPSHHRPRIQAELQDMGILWARAGCAVLVADLIGQGERTETYPWNREGYHARYNLGLQLYVAGESLIKWMVWDIMRGVDLLLERSDVDPARIILLGAVAGGGDPAAVAAALDARITAVAPFNFGEATPKYSGRGPWPGDLADPGWGAWESTRTLPGSISGQYLPWVICASVAPRRLIFAYEMGWDVERQPAWVRYRKVFGLYGAAGNLDEAQGFGAFPGPGECTNIGPAQRKTLYPELNRWFGIPIPAMEPNDRRAEAELAALTPAATAKLAMKTVHEVARGSAAVRLETARAQMSSRSPRDRRAWLRAKWSGLLGDVEPSSATEARLHWSRELPNALVEALELRPEPEIILPVLLLAPKNRRGRAPVVVAVSQGGKERFLADRAREIDKLLGKGFAVCLPDLRGTGETAPDYRRGPGSAGITLAATELMLGNTLLGARLKDLRTTLAYLARRSEVDADRVALWGDSPAPPNPDRLLVDESPGWQIAPQIQHQAEPLGGLLVLLGALFEDRVRAVNSRGGLVSFLSVLDSPFAYIPGDVVIPGMIDAGDVDDLVASLAPRPVLLEGLVDGRNRLVSGTGLRDQLKQSGSAYQSAPNGALVMRQSEATPEFAEWLVGRI